MLLRAAPCLLALAIAMGPARAEDVLPAAAPAKTATPTAAAAPAAQASAVSGGEPAAIALRRATTTAPTSAFREHAPIALFSVGALAVGGVFYGIHSQVGDPGEAPVSGNGKRMNMALGAAGITAAAAGAAYLYYALTSDGADHDAPAWSETFSGGVSPDGGIAARLTVPLSALAD